MPRYLRPETIRDAERVRVPARIAKEMLHDLRAWPVDWRREYITALTNADMRELAAAAWQETGSYYGLWQDDPVGFYEVVLGETLWSKQREVLAPLADDTVRSVIVPAGFGLGKTHVGGGATCWFGSVWPVGSAGVVTTATRMRQVSHQLWPHVRRLHAKAGLPGSCDMTQWVVPDSRGVITRVAYGFTAPENDEAAMQGIHFPKILVIVDEAGGIDRNIGNATRNLLTGDHARLLAIGNPPTDDEGSWFEQESERGMSTDPKHRRVITVTISARSSPAVTGEDVPCLAHPDLEPHGIATHLVDQEWIDDAVDEHGADAPYVIAKVDAKFPRGGSARAIPGAYVDGAIEAYDLFGQWWPEEFLSGEPSVTMDGTPYAVQPPLGAVINLGVDVAADGGDELSIARQEGDIARLRHFQSGAGLESSMDVSGIILREIIAAENLRHALGTVRRVHVKVDVIGLGWGVVGTLKAWGTEQRHDAVIVPVDVRELPDRPDDKRAVWRPARKRDEMWLNGREMFKPDPTGRPRMRLDVDSRTAAQLRGPTYSTDSSGHMVIESKKSMRTRGIPSPDRGESVLLAIYDAAPKKSKKVRVLA